MSGGARRPGGCSVGSGRATSSRATWRRMARCGTRPGNSSRCLASWRGPEGEASVSGPLEDAEEVMPGLGISAIEVREGRTAQVGAMSVLRVLPTKRRRTVGPWCFVDLPVAELPNARARVIAGEVAGEHSPARIDHPTVGLDVTLRGATEIQLDPSFEHGVVPVDRPLKVDDAIVELGSLALVPAGYERVRIEELGGSARFLLLGGEPFGVESRTWWHCGAPTFDDI